MKYKMLNMLTPWKAVADVTEWTILVRLMQMNERDRKMRDKKRDIIRKLNGKRKREKVRRRERRDIQYSLYVEIERETEN